MQPYKINDEFIIFPDSNQVSNTTKLEPRLMKLLSLLVENRGNLVSREEIVEKIWEGYGGGDEGLTQAISFLRKVLNDTDKQIIETVSKGGYIFRGRASILDEQVTALPAASHGQISYKTAGIAAGVLIIIFVVIFYLFYTRKPSERPDNITPKPPQENHTPRADSIAPKPPQNSNTPKPK